MKWGWVFLQEHLKNVYLKFHSKFYMECEIEFDSLGLKYKECFIKSLTVVFEMETAFVWITFNDLSRPTIIQLFQGYIGA